VFSNRSLFQRSNLPECLFKLDVDCMKLFSALRELPNELNGQTLPGLLADDIATAFHETSYFEI
jgi:hypothetical protein